MNSLALLLVLSLAPCAIAYINPYPYRTIGWSAYEPAGVHQVTPRPMYGTRSIVSTTTTTTAAPRSSIPTLEEKHMAQDCYFNRTWKRIDSLNLYLENPNYERDCFCFQVAFNVPTDLNDPVDIAFYSQLNTVYNQMELVAVQDKKAVEQCYWLFSRKFAPCYEFVKRDRLNGEVTPRGQYRLRVWNNLKMIGYFCYEGNDTPLCVEYRATRPTLSLAHHGVDDSKRSEESTTTEDYESTTTDDYMSTTTEDYQSTTTTVEPTLDSTTTTSYDDIDQGDDDDDMEVIKMNTEDPFEVTSTTQANSTDEWIDISE